MTDSPVSLPVDNKEAAEYFSSKKYVIVDSALDAETCKDLTDYMLKLVEDRKTTKDVQCPLSESIYGDQVLDAVLEDLKPKIEAATGLSLIPTYSYARKYAPGDELKPHTDREACEISATLTLGFEGDVWPIHVSTDDKVENDIGEILMKPGDMVIYRGMEINHWREPYTQGKWQCQVFLHYVDANGPHKDLKYDGRENLGVPKANANQNGRPLWVFGFEQDKKFLYLTKEKALTDPFIDSIVLHGSKETEYARIGMDVGEVNKSIRNVLHSWLDMNKFAWLYQHLESHVSEANWMNYRYVLTHMEQIDYLEYHGGHGVEEENGKYVAHVDGGIDSTRKLSFSILLSDPSEFEGGDLLIYEHGRPCVVPKKKGLMTFFPSNVLHEVTPVTKGVRRSIVSWVHGPHFS